MLRILRVILAITTFLCFLQGGVACAQAPNADFAADDSIVCISNTITFSDLSTPGAVPVITWNWNFGDGSTSVIQNPQHSYAAGGTYQVQLIITDANGLKDTAYHSIYVLVAQVVRSSIHICSPQNNTTVIAVDPNIPGVFGTWFTSSSAVIASPSNDTSAVTNLISGTYLLFWVVSDGQCSAASQVSITVDQPVVSNAGPDQQLCSTAGSATLAGSAPAPGTGLWTTNSAAVITSPTNKNSTVTGISATGTYMFVWTVSNTSCRSTDTMFITVSAPVTANAGADQLICNSNPSTTLTGSNPAPGTAVWTTTGSGTITSPSSSTTTVTALPNGINTFIYTVTNGGCISKDTMLVTVSTLKTANAGPDRQVCTSTGTGTLTGNNPTPGTGLWTAVSAGVITSPSSATTTVTGLSSPGFYNFVWTITNGGCVSRDTVTFIVRNPVIANAGIDQQYCAVTTAVITGNNPAPGSGTWTTTSTATIATPSAATSNVSGLPYGSNAFVYTTSYGACVSRDTMIIKVDSVITANAGADQQICSTSSSVTLAGNNPSPGTGLWTAVNGGTITTPSSASSTVTGLVAGTYHFVWTISNGACTSRDTMIVLVSTQIPSNAGADQRVCQGTPATLTGNNPSPGSGLWSALNGGTITSPSNPVTTITGLNAAGTYSFIWTITNGACILKDTVSVVVDSNIVANAGADQQLCNLFSANLAGNNATPGNGTWSTTGTATIASPSNPLTAVNNLAFGNNVFIWTIIYNTCTSRDTVIIHVDSVITANAGSDQSVCSVPGSVILSGNNPAPGTGLWTSAPAAVFSNASNPASTASGLSTAGAYTLIWTVTNGACIRKDTMLVNVSSLKISDAGPDQRICSNTASATLAGNNPAPGTGTWSTPGTAIIATPSSPSSTVTNLAVGNNTFIWTITNGACTSKDTIVIKVDQLVTALAGSDQNLCIGTPVNLSANNPSPGTGNWLALNGGTLSSPSSASTSVTGINSAGTYNFTWTITNGSCVSADTVAIIESASIIADAGPAQILCNTDSTILSANNPSPGSGSWTTTGTAIFSSSTSASSPVHNLSPGINTLIWSITNGACISRDTVFITVSNVVTAVAGNDQQVCAGTIVNLSGNNPSPGSGLWTALNGGTITSTNLPNTTVTGLNSAGTYNFVWTITNNSCSSSDTVRIIVDSLITSSAGSDQQICNVNTITLNAVPPVSGTGSWSTAGAGNIVSTSNPSTQVTGLTAGLYQFIWTVSSNSCISRDTVQVIIDSLVIADAGSDQQVCSSPGTAFVIAADRSPYSGMWTAVPAVVFADPFANSTSVSGLLTGTDTLIYSISNGSCNSSDTLILTVDSNIIANAGADQFLCQSISSTSLAANSAAPGTGSWSTASTAVIADTLNPNTTVSGLGVGTYNFTWTITNGTCTTSDTVTVSVSALADSAHAGVDQVICQNLPVQLNANNPVTGTGIWSATGTAVFSDVNNPSATVTGLLPGTTNLIWTITNGACSNSDTVTVIVNPIPVADAGADQFIMTGSSAVIGGTPAASGGAAPYTYVWSPGSLLNDSLAANPVFTAGFSTQFILNITDSLGCQDSDTMQVYVNDPMVAVNDSVITAEDTSIVINILANDTDPNNNINPGSAGILAGPFHGSASINSLTGAITYIPAANYFGADSIFYTVCDSGLPVYCDSAWIYINITPVNDAPVAIDDSATTVQDSCISINVLINDSDIENALVNSSLAVLNGPFHGVATIDTISWQIIYCPDSSFAGTDTIYYTVCDSGMPVLCDSAMVIISINPQNHAPSALNDSVRVCSSDSIIVNVLINDSDPDLNPLTCTLLNMPVNGTASLLLNSVFYIPSPGFSGLDSLKYMVCDNGTPSLCDTAVIYFTVLSAPQVTSVIQHVKCAGDTTGAVDISVTGLSPFTYNWNNGSLSQDIDSLTVGVYTVTVTDSSGCVASVTNFVNSPLAPLSGLLSIQPVACFGDSTGAIDLQVQDGTPGYTYAWSNAATTQDIDSLLAGVYTVMITDSNGCKLQLADTVKAPASVFILNASSTDITCSGDSSGSVILTPSGGVPGYVYNWSNGSTADTLNNLAAGLYAVTVTDAFGCALTLADTIKELHLPVTASVISNTPFCISGQAGTLGLSVSGGVIPYSCIWNTGDTTLSLSNLAAGSYTYTITDSAGCTKMDSITLADSSAIQFTLSDSILCAGQLALLTATSYNNVSYQWFQNNIALPADTSSQLTTGNAGSYYVNVTAACGVFNSSPVNIIVNPLPVVSAGTDVTTTCDSSIMLNASGDILYQWTPGILCSDSLISNPVVSPQVSTDFIVTTTNNNGCSAKDTIHVTVNCDSLVIPDGFSPNGDGINDYFVITKVGEYPGNVLKVFNRWGNLVFEKTDYDNSWNGQSNVNFKLGDFLTDGTYYYVFDTRVPGKIWKGFVIIRR